jgi:PilZ domain
MKVEQHRAMRRPFAARVEVVEVESERQVSSVTGDLSVFGCFVETPAPFPHGTKVRIRINHRGTTFVAHGFVSNVRPTGMGIRFGAIEPAHQQILENWLAQLRTSPNSS